MQLFTNGFPKSGNHALVKACELLGQPAEVAHEPYKRGVPFGTTHTIFIKRDPRNITLSMLRFSNQTVSPGTLISRFRKFESDTLVNEMTAYEGWLTAPNTLVVKFEDLIKSDETMYQIAGFLGIPYIPGAWENLPGLTFTWTGSYSDYTKIWTPEVEDVWNAEGGPELLSRWGY